MILDGHIHIHSIEDTPDQMLNEMKKRKIDGGLLISAMPDNMDEKAADFKLRVDHVINCCKGQPYLFPFFFINPICEDAIEQIDYAVKQGIAGFKIICNKFKPDDPRCVEVYHHIAKYNKPILFHTGILWDGINASGCYNRPVEFEVLLKIEGLRFSLAHISWPWCDENLAVYGKFDHSKKTLGNVSSEMFIDITPGTPEIYRQEALTKVFTIGYDIRNNVIFGLDNAMHNYDGSWAEKWLAIDDEIYHQLNLTAEEIDQIYAGNLLRFIGE